MASGGQQFTIEQFYKFCSEGKLMAVKCNNCGKVFLPPQQLCPNCYSDNLEWKQLKGEGEVVTYTVIHVPTIEFQDEAPYGVAVVKFDEGVQFVGMVKEYQKLRIGQRVKVRFEEAEYKHLKGFPRRARIVLEPLE